MDSEIVVVIASIAFGMVILLARPRIETAARRKVGRLVPAVRSAAAGLMDLARPWPVAFLLYGLAVVALFLDHNAVRDGLPQFLLLAGLALASLVFWFRELLFLMALRDDELPGRFDKPIWAFLLIALPPVGLIAFRCHRAAHLRPEPSPLAKPKPTIDYGQELA